MGLSSLLSYYMCEKAEFIPTHSIIVRLYIYHIGSVKTLFVLTLDKTKLKNKKTALLLFSVLFVFILTFVVIYGIKSKDYDTIDGKRLNTVVKCNEDIVRISGYFNITINESNVSSEKIVLPKKFNQIYEAYNRLQKNIGCDLSDYMGRECVKYSVKILSDDKSDDSIMTILVCDDHFIGGDISSSDFNGKIASLNSAE